MECLNTRQLERLLRGGPEGFLSAAYAHARACDVCRAELRRLAARSGAAVEFTAALVGAADCPDYELLSAFVDGKLEAQCASAVQVHMNLCEACARDVDRIGELRSRAALREPVTVRPGASVRRAPGLAPALRRGIAAALFAGAVAAIVIALLPLPTTPPRRTTIAVAPSQTAAERVEAPSTAPQPTETPAAKPTVPPEKAAPSPSYRVVLVDGRYQVAKRNGKLAILKAGNPVSVPGSLLAKIAQKLYTGKVTLSQPAAVAMSSIRVRGEDYVPPPTAPKLVDPVGKIVLSDRPTLSWSGAELARSYRVTIKDLQGNTVREEITTKRAYTPSPALARGETYLWQVGVRFNDSDQWTLSRAARFKVLSSEDYSQVRRVARSLPGSHLALAVTYESLGLSDEAAHEYRLLKKANPRIRL